MTQTLFVNDQGKCGVARAIEGLKRNEPLLDLIEAAIKLVEDDASVCTVGYGGAPNMLGQMELDASIMDGTTFRTGAVGALKGFANAISVARQIMERLPHVMLVGEGAARFAYEIGATPEKHLEARSNREYEKWLGEQKVTQEKLSSLDTPLVPLSSPEGSHNPHGTTTFMAINSAGDIAGGVSTAGWDYKYPGRLGDSPIIGAGLYVDSRYGAANCTHTGEMSIRSGTARAIVAYMEMGLSARDAGLRAHKNLRELKGGHLGPLLIRILDRSGEPCVLSMGKAAPSGSYFWRSGMRAADEIWPEVID